MMNATRAKRQDYYRAVVAAWEAIPPGGREALENWERIYIPRGMATTDWPGWKNIVADFTGEPGYRKKAIPPSLRSSVFERDGWMCLHCGATDDLSADHIEPEFRGGPTILKNLQTLCRRCNSRKGTS